MPPTVTTAAMKKTKKRRKIYDWHQTVKMRSPRACRRPVGFQVFDNSIVEIEDEEYYPKKVNVKARRNERISKTDDIRIAPK